jgi:hypothetical protein
MRACVAAGLLTMLAAGPVWADGVAQPMGFVIDNFEMAIYQTPTATECPAGFLADTSANFEVEHKTEAERRARFQIIGHVQNRGPAGENVWVWPEVIRDPLPFHSVQSTTAFGKNLDGTSDGHATANSCQHEKFTDPDGHAGIDNQLYRIVGCMPVYRKSGVFVQYMKGELKSKVWGRVLMEISDVNDPLNDPDVTVTLYKGRDLLALDDLGNTIPWQTQTVDERFPQYITRIHGSIENGVLRTRPVERVRIPHLWLRYPGEIRIQDMQLELKLTDNGAEGMLVGYHDIDDWYKNHRKPSMVLEGTSGQSAPALYATLKQLADGHKDPATGQCHSISGAHFLKATRVFIAHRVEGALVTNASVR